MSYTKYAVVCSLAAVFLRIEVAGAQFRGGGPPSPERVFDYLDRNRDGVLDPSELDRVPPPVREAMDRMDVDDSRPISREDFMQLSRQIQEEMQRGPDGGPSNERDSTNTRSSDRGRRESSSRGRSSPSGTTSPQPRPRVTVDMPESYRERDKDHDGQIGLYEWERGAFAEFRRMDQNGDGFLTPRELVSLTGTPSNAPRAAGVAPVAFRTSSALPSPVPSSAPAPSSSPSRTSSETPEDDSREARMASFLFRSLDRDNDQSLSAEEWQHSKRTRQSFERANVQIAFPVKYEQFVEAYKRVAKKPRRR